MTSLGPRLLSSACLIALTLATLFLLPLWAYAVVVGGFIAVALAEFFTMVRHRGIQIHRPLGVTLGVIFTSLVAWRSLVEPGLVQTPVVGPGGSAVGWLWDVFWPATIVLLFIRQFARENTFEALSGLATTLFGMAYIAYLLSFLFYIRTLDPAQGAWLVCYLILVTKMGDAGAYGVGSVLGRTVLMPRISPRKTVEGSIGGIVVSGLTAMAARPMLGALDLTVGWAFGLGVLLGVGGQLGDLAESLLKRDCQVKDAGVVPGLGGVLDVIDSLLFTAPIFYAILIYG